MLDSVYHMVLKSLLSHIFGAKSLYFASTAIMDVNT